MRLPPSSRHAASGPNMTPMIDVVFLLIIFFLVSSHLVKQETQTPLDLPVAMAHQPPPERDQRLVVNVHSDQSLSIRGRQVDRAELRQLLHREVADRGRNAQLHIRCDQASPYRVIEPILQAASHANVSQITFAVIDQP